MLRSMTSAVSGLRNHQLMLDQVSNDIANVNTVGYKSSRITFKDALSQTIRGSSAGISGGTSTTNPAQLGLGAEIGNIDALMSQGALSLTGQSLDLAIQGEGFFRTTDDPTGFTNVQLTRAGNFQMDNSGNVVTTTGRYVIGYTADPVTGAPTTTPTVLNVPTTAKSLNIDQGGLVTYIDAAGALQTVGYVTIAKMPNAAGLERISGNNWRETPASGPETVTTAGVGGAGPVASGALELSNVDLARAFSDMIIAQRAYQANSRMISTSDEMLQALVQMKR